MVSVPARSYPYFDWLRIVLASLVYWQHANVTNLVGFGDFAVQVFFALSGWLIGGILLASEPAGLPRFFFNRATRIWFPYFAAVVLLYGVAVLKEGTAPLFFRTLALDLTFMHNWFIEKIPPVLAAMPMQGTGAHFWSIAVEEQFYLIASLLLVLTPMRRSILAWAVVSAAAILWSGFYGSISMGVLAAMLHRRWPDWHLGGLATALLGAVIALSGWAIWTQRLPYGQGIPFVAVAIVLILARPGRRTAPGVFAGGISYPMYLNHWTGLFAANLLVATMPGLPRLSALVLGFGFALLAASVAFLMIDRPVMRLRGAFYTPGRGKAAAAAAYALAALGIGLGTQWSLGP